MGQITLSRAVAALFLTAAVLACTGFGPPVITDGRNPALRMAPDQISAAVRLKEPPAVSAAAVLVVDLDAGVTLIELNSHKPLPPASTVKLMTALLTVQRARLDDVVRVSAGAAGTEGSRMGLGAGESFTVRELLYGLLLPSGNDAAVALAEHVAGSEEQFVGLMNEAAAGMGMADTYFVSAHGLDDPAQHSTAADLVVLARAVLAQPLLAEVVSTSSATVAGHQLTNTNLLLGQYPGADGVKTGTTDAAGECLVASVTRGGHRRLAVVLGSADRYRDARMLFDTAAAGWQWRPISLPDDGLAWTADASGRRYRLRVTQSIDVLLPAWQWRQASPVRVLDISVPLTGTAPVGTLRLQLAGQDLGVVPLTIWREP